MLRKEPGKYDDPAYYGVSKTPISDGIFAGCKTNSEPDEWDRALEYQRTQQAQSYMREDPVSSASIPASASVGAHYPGQAQQDLPQRRKLGRKAVASPSLGLAARARAALSTASSSTASSSPAALSSTAAVPKALVPNKFLSAKEPGSRLANQSYEDDFRAWDCEVHAAIQNFRPAPSSTKHTPSTSASTISPHISPDTPTATSRLPPFPAFGTKPHSRAGFTATPLNSDLNCSGPHGITYDNCLPDLDLARLIHAFDDESSPPLLTTQIAGSDLEPENFELNADAQRQQQNQQYSPNPQPNLTSRQNFEPSVGPSAEQAVALVPTSQVVLDENLQLTSPVTTTEAAPVKLVTCKLESAPELETLDDLLFNEYAWNDDGTPVVQEIPDRYADIDYLSVEDLINTDAEEKAVSLESTASLESSTTLESSATLESLATLESSATLVSADCAAPAQVLASSAQNSPLGKPIDPEDYLNYANLRTAHLFERSKQVLFSVDLKIAAHELGMPMLGLRNDLSSVFDALYFRESFAEFLRDDYIDPARFTNLVADKHPQAVRDFAQAAKVFCLQARDPHQAWIRAVDYNCKLTRTIVSKTRNQFAKAYVPSSATASKQLLFACWKRFFLRFAQALEQAYEPLNPDYIPVFPEVMLQQYLAELTKQLAI